MDAAHVATDKELERIEKKLTEIYSRAESEIGETWKKYLSEQDAKIKDLQSAYDAAKKSGDKAATRKAGRTLAGAKKERTIMDSHYRRMTEKLARDISSVNEKAMAYVNGRLPKVYATNYNEFSKELENEQMGISFELVDESTVRNLAMTDNTLLPYKKVNGKKDVRWNVQRLNAEVMQGILQGEPMDKIASRFSNVLGMNEASAIRNARTSVTSAENKGRIDMLHDARKKGVIADKIWIAAHDSRTRHWHSDLDGVEKAMDEPFENVIIASKIKSYPDKIMYPGDPDAAPANTYNCRCTLGYKVIGFEKRR